MSSYTIPIQYAMMIFPILACVITLPYIIVQYRTYGSLLSLRIAIVYSFVFYLLCAYFMTILPLPPRELVATYTNPTMQLIPFHFLQDLSLGPTVEFTSIESILQFVGKASFYTVAFNGLLLMPLGIYARYYFRLSLKKTILIAFLVSLSFELLQLSALFGYYPRPYRLFDVDDLLINIVGGMIGYALTPLLAHFLPNRETIDIHAYEKGLEVSATRRMFAFGIDSCVILGLTALLYLLMEVIQPMKISTLLASYGILVCLFFFIIPILSHGKTLGKRVVKIALVHEDGTRATWYRYIIRYFFLYMSIVPAPFVLSYAITFIMNTKQDIVKMITITLIYLIYVVIIVFQGVASLHSQTAQPFFIKWSQLHNTSTIDLDEEGLQIITEQESSLESASDDVAKHEPAIDKEKELPQSEDTKEKPAVNE